MPVNKMKPFFDSRVTLKTALVNGYTYGYLHALPPSGTRKRATVVLVHGFPDLSFGWRHQIPFLANMGLEVIAPDCLGYGRSDAPPTCSIKDYTYKRIATDIASICDQLGISQIILGGHDWGGAIVYRVAQLQPNLVKAVFSICTPYEMPQPTYLPLAQLVAKQVPNFTYQVHFASGELEAAIKSPIEIRQFLNALYGARSVTTDGSRGESAFDVNGRVGLHLLPRMGKTKLLSDEEMDYYVHEYSRNGMNGPLNWYRSREARFLDDLDFFFDGPTTDPKKFQGKIITVDQPTLFVFATKDTALQEWMSRTMGQRIPKLTKRTVQAGHWALWEKPEECNQIIGEWMEKTLKGMNGSKL